MSGLVEERSKKKLLVYTPALRLGYAPRKPRLIARRLASFGCRPFSSQPFGPAIASGVVRRNPSGGIPSDRIGDAS